MRPCIEGEILRGFRLSFTDEDDEEEEEDASEEAALRSFCKSMSLAAAAAVASAIERPSAISFNHKLTSVAAAASRCRRRSSIVRLP